MRRIVIVGGVAGGASCAARARRLDESARIVIFERGPHVSFANCGLPYHVGDVIPDEADLLLSSPARFAERLDVEVHVDHEVLRVDRAEGRVEVRDRRTGRTFFEPYDALVLATGAAPVRPPLPGLDQEGVFTLRTVPDAARLRAWIDARQARRAVVVGAGPIGLEVAENLARRGIEVQVVERLPQVMAPLDPEMAAPVAEHLRAQGVTLHLGDGLASIEPGLVVRTASGLSLPTDLVLLGIGVRPEVALARDAGIEVGALGGVRVDAAMRTSDPRVWAVGDMVEDACAITGEPLLAPLAGPANRQGRLAADAISGRDVAFRGVQGTLVCGVFELTVAATGRSEKSLRASGRDDIGAVWLHPKDHVGYYPGAETIHLKLVFELGSGRVLGAQAVGRKGVERRIDVVAMAIQMGATVFDLEQAELCYAPAYGAAKDPVNMAGMIAANQLRGDLLPARWEDVGASDALLVDVREAKEFAAGSVPGAVSLPLSALRGHLDELPRDREIQVFCESGKRSYDAARALMQRGFRVRNLPGGMASWRHRQAAVADAM